MIKMNPSVVSIALLASLSVAYADVSHLTNGHNGYFYPNLGLGDLHTPQNPPPTQYATFGDHLVSSNLPNSYSPIPSGSPFQDILPGAYASPRLSAPLQSPLLAGQKYQNQQQQQQQQQQQAQTRNLQYQNQVGSTADAFSQAQQQVQAFRAQNQATSSATSTASSNAYSQTQVSNQQPIITKHFYVHAAPEDPEEQVVPKYVQLGPPRKNYKIIFIKAPTYSSSAQFIPLPPQTEDKTIVYVLSKKPTFEQNIQLPEQPVTEPSKPDVFFVKYKNQQEVEQAQQSIQAAYDQANLSSADSADQIASQFITDTDSGSTTAFGGQDSFQQNQFGGHSSSTTQVKRSAQRRF